MEHSGNALLRQMDSKSPKPMASRLWVDSGDDMSNPRGDGGGEVCKVVGMYAAAAVGETNDWLTTSERRGGVD